MVGSTAARRRNRSAPRLARNSASVAPGTRHSLRLRFRSRFEHVCGFSCGSISNLTELRIFSRRRRTYVQCQHSTQQAQTRMSRCANVCALKRRKSCQGKQPARISFALALRNHWKRLPDPVRSPQKLSDTIRSDLLRRDGQPKWGHARASFREMVQFAPPRTSRGASAEGRKSGSSCAEQNFVELYF